MKDHALRAHLRAVVVLFLLICGACAQANAQSPATWNLIEIVGQDPAAKWDARSAVDVHIDSGPLVEGRIRSGDLLQIPTIGGESEAYTVLRAGSWLPGTYSVTARKRGMPGEYIALSYSQGRTIGRIRSLADDGLLEVSTDASLSVSRLQQVDPAALDRLECGVDHDHALDLIYSPGLGKNAGAPAPASQLHVEALLAAVDEPVTIDLMLVYTAKAKSWAEQNVGSIELAISQMMNLSQLALDNSGVGIDLRVVHTYEVAYDEASSSDSATHLRRMTVSPSFNPFGEEYDGFMNEIHTLRAQHGADLVAMLAEISDVGGLAWRLGNFGGAAPLGFSINRIQQLTSSYTLIHEIGHNLGNSHSRNQVSATATVFGGIFPYSTGWRWQGTDQNMYASVMTYLEGSREAAMFSSPDLMHEGGAAGSYTGTFSPADNRRSMREMKRVVASYLPTRIDPPVLSVSPASLNVTIPSGARHHVTLSIGNQGVSNLAYDLDFAHASVPKAAFAKSSSEPPLVAPDASSGANARAPGALAADAQNGAIYSTTFSQAEGFSTGTHLVRELWQGWTDGHTFEVSSANPSVGDQHLRLQRIPALESSLRVVSPYFGPRPLGAYRFSADLAINLQNQGNYFIYFLDSRTLNLAAGFAFSGEGHVFVVDEVQNGQISFTYAGTSWTQGAYRRISVEFSPDDGAIRYYYNNTFLISRPMEYGTSVGQMMIVHPNSESTLDLDNIEFQSEHAGFSWLDVDRFAGTVAPNQTAQVGVDFDARGFAQGVYDGIITLATNDPQNPSAEIAVRLTVAGDVSVEDAGQPSGYRLVQNFPNPFNPTTRIEFSLAEPQHATLEIFSVTGQQVAVLVDRFMAEGSHSHAFDASTLAGGVYFYRLTAGDFTDVKRMVLLK